MTRVYVFQVHSQVFAGLKEKTFSKILIDPVQSEHGDTRAYISMENANYILVYSFNEKKLGKLKFT
jgi:hypothetical protein